LLWGTVSADEINLPADPDALRALFADMQARITASEQALEAERTAHEATRNAVKLTTLQIEKLKVQLSRLRRMKFGQSSERITEMADQLELTLEDLEAEHARVACALGEPVPTEE
jgi:transposase